MLAESSVRGRRGVHYVWWLTLIREHKPMNHGCSIAELSQGVGLWWERSSQEGLPLAIVGLQKLRKLGAVLERLIII